MPRTTKRSSSRGRTSSSSLEAYREKRDFAGTPEPPPEAPPANDGPLTFVVQKHAARRLHYDFRLELNGALKSWSVPKGPSLDPKEKRLAVLVEDHPLDYGSFEGVIPNGQYGAGQVIVWDNGTYSPDEGGGLSFHDPAEAAERMLADLAKGKLSITLRGRKLKGSWTLVKITRAENEWLLIKHQDSAADPERDILQEDRSMLSGLNIEDLKSGRLPDAGRGDLRILRPEDLPGARRCPFPKSLAPMMATPTDAPFSDPDWLFEPKLDGMRAIALIQQGGVKLLSRSGLDATNQYPSLAEELARQPAEEVALDGEIVAVDEEGRPSFELLQQRLNLTNEADIRRAEAEIPVLYYVFDLLHLDGYDLSAAALQHRRFLLERVLLPSSRVHLLEGFDEAGEIAYQAALEHGLEGIVAKRRDSRYDSGKRSHQWLKIKSVLSDDFVIGGYSRGLGGRAKTFGALLIGQYDEAGRLIYAGHVGSGLDDRTLGDLRRRLSALRTKDCPFSEVPPLKAETTWVRPELAVEVQFAQWTQEGNLRAPVFRRLREDKRPEEVRVAVVSSREAGNTPEDLASPQKELEGVLQQLEGSREKFLLEVEGQRISLSNLGKELWPKLRRRRALTKRDLLVYLAKVAPYLLTHVRDRPLTLTRYPNGIDGKRFFQKHWDSAKPDFVETVRLYSSHNEGDQEYILCNNLPTVLWLGQVAGLELHTWYSRIDPTPDAGHLTTRFTGTAKNIDGSTLNHPDFIIFDLDPYIYSGREAKGDEPALNRKAFTKTCEVALWLKEVLDSLSLSSFVKTSGRTGLHIYVPILRQLDYSAVRAACESIGRFLMGQHPREITMDWTVEKRAGKVFFDHNQNVRGKTVASTYSPRPLPEAAVSMPLRWDELLDVYPTDFTILTAPDRLAQVGDLWAGILEAKHDLEGLLAAKAPS